jgi:hypothetical protein
MMRCPSGRVNLCQMRAKPTSGRLAWSAASRRAPLRANRYEWRGWPGFLADARLDKSAGVVIETNGSLVGGFDAMEHWPHKCRSCRLPARHVCFAPPPRQQPFGMVGQPVRRVLLGLHEARGGCQCFGRPLLDARAGRGLETENKHEAVIHGPFAGPVSAKIASGYLGRTDCARRAPAEGGWR